MPELSVSFRFFRLEYCQTKAQEYSVKSIFYTALCYTSKRGISVAQVYNCLFQARKVPGDLHGLEDLSNASCP